MTTLGQHIRTQKGYAFKSGWYGNEGRPIVKVSDFTDDSIDSSGLVRIPERIADDYMKYELRPGDVVIQTVGSWPNNPNSVVGKAVRVPGDVAGALLNQNAVKVEPTEELDRRFLYYLLRSERFKSYIVGTAQGAASQAAITLDSIRAFSFELPRLDTQKRAAETLSAYDDLIENNARRIKILEEMAQSLYREWFVHFRFPGHEKVKLVDSGVGKVPQDWKVCNIGEVVGTLGGGTPSTKSPEFWDSGDVIWFTPSDLTAAGTMFIETSGKKISNLGLEKSSARLFPPYCVMMTSRATIGVVAINTKEACTNQGFITCIPNELVSAYQIYFWMLDNKAKIIGIASGATYKEINRTEFRELPIVVAEIRINKRFVETVMPICKQIENLQARNATLRRTRDLLLPKLISGECSC